MYLQCRRFASPHVQAIRKWASESYAIQNLSSKYLLCPCKVAQVAIPSKFICSSLYSSVQVQYYFGGSFGPSGKESFWAPVR